MAREPYDPVNSVSPTGATDTPLTVQATPAAFGAQVGQATEKLGGSVEQAGKGAFEIAVNLQQMKNTNDALSVNTAASAAVGDAQVKFRSLSGQNAVDAYPQFQQQISAIRDQYAGQLASPMARQQFLQGFAGVTDRAMTVAGIHVGEQAKTALVGGLQSNIAEEQSSLVRFAATTGAIPDMGTLTDRALTMAHELGYGKDQADAFVQKTVGDTVNYMVTTSIGSADPNSFNRAAQAQKIFNQALNMNAPGTDLPLVGAQHIGEIEQKIQNTMWQDQMRAQGEQARQDRAALKAAGQLRVGVETQISNAGALIDNGKPPTVLPNAAQIQAAYPFDPERAAGVTDTVAAMHSIGDQVARLPNMTPLDIAEETKALTPDANDPNYARTNKVYEMWDKAVRGHIEELKADPANLVMGGHPDVANAWQSATGTNAAPGAFDAYVSSTLGVQSMLGVPREMQHVLPAANAVDMASKITANPETAPAAMKQMQQQFGSHWNDVWHDLSTIGKLPVQYQAVGTLDNERDASLLARAINESTKDKGKSWDEILGPKALNNIDTAVRSDPSVLAMVSSLSRSGSSADQISGILGSINTLGYAKAFYDADPSAAQKAIASFTGKYDFSLPGAPRVPAKAAGGVSYGASSLLQGLTPDKVAVPQIYGQPAQPKPEEYIDLIKASPTWVTSPRADSIMLMDPYGRLVRQPDGEPFSVPFSTVAPALPSTARPLTFHAAQ